VFVRRFVFGFVVLDIDLSSPPSHNMSLGEYTSGAPIGTRRFEAGSYAVAGGREFDGRH